MAPARRSGPGDPVVLAPNDPHQYDGIVGGWEDPHGPLSMLHWLAAARAELIPPATRPGAVLVDLGCGGGLLAPAAAGLGYRHVGVDVTASGLRVAARRGVTAVQGDVRHVPLADAVADVVVAGEILEHVTDPAAVVAHATRVLHPGGTLVVDTIARTRLARFVAVTLAERLPAGPPPGIHDPALLVDRAALVAAAAAGGVALRLHGLRPSLPGYLAWLARRRDLVAMRRTRDSSILVAGAGRKAGTLR